MRMLSRIIEIDKEMFEETFEDHIALVLGFMERLKKRRLRALARAIKRFAEHIGEEVSDEEALSLADKALFYAALLHDIGKLNKKFQEDLRRGGRTRIRHELLSAFLAYAYLLHELPIRLRKAVAWAIALHHQKRTVGKIRCEEATYRLTAKLFLALSGLSSERFKETLSETDLSLIVENREELKQRFEELSYDEALRIARDLLAFGAGPLEKALVDIILSTLIEADRLAAMYATEGLKDVSRLGGAALEALENVEPKDVPKIKARRPEIRLGAELIEIATPRFNPTYDSLWLFGFLELLNASEGLVYSSAGEYVIRVPRRVLERLSGDRRKLRVLNLLKLAYTKLPGTFGNERLFLGKLLLKYAIDQGEVGLKNLMRVKKKKEGGKEIEIIQQFKQEDFEELKRSFGKLYSAHAIISLHIGGTYIRTPFSRGSKSDTLKKKVEESIDGVVKRLKEYGRAIEEGDKPLIAALAFIGLAFYTPVYRKNNILFVAYPIIAPGGPRRINSLRFSYANSLTKFMSVLKSEEELDLYGILLYLVNELAPAIDLDALDFHIVAFDVGGNQPAARSALYLSASNIWNLFLDLIAGDRLHKHGNLNELCETFNNIFRSSTHAFSLLARGIEELNVAYVYEAVRILATKGVSLGRRKEKATREHFFILLIQRIIDRIVRHQRAARGSSFCLA